MSLDLAIQDIKRISQAGFSRSIVFTAPDNVTTATVRGLVSKHNMSVDPETGTPVNARNAHISVHESILLQEGYPTRSGGELSLSGHKVEWVDASEVSYSYRIKDVWPSETTGLIVCSLTDLE